MYKYNMYEFIEKVNLYLIEKGYGFTLYLKQDQYAISYYHLRCDLGSNSFSFTTKDTSDFENDVYILIDTIKTYL